MSYFSSPYCPITLVRKAKVVPLASGPNFKTSSLRILQKIALVGSFNLRVTKGKEGSWIISTQDQKSKVRHLY